LNQEEMYLQTAGAVTMQEKIQAAIDRVRPSFKADGGDADRPS